MIVTYDTEFLDDGKTIELISLGMVAEDGQRRYLVNAEADLGRVLDVPWMVDNVIKHLPVQLVGTGWDWDDAHPDRVAVCDRQAMAKIVESFLKSFNGPDEVDLWAYYPATDHVALYQLFGPMTECTRHGMPMRTSCLKQEEVSWYRFMANQTDERSVIRPRVRRLTRPVQDPRTEHHALHDARHDMDLARWLGLC
jgi:hypothetical protein